MPLLSQSPIEIAVMSHALEKKRELLLTALLLTEKK